MRSSVQAAAALVALIVIVGAVYFSTTPSVQTSTQSGSNSQSTRSQWISSVSSSLASNSGASSTSSQHGVSSSTERWIDWVTYHANNARTGYKNVSNFTSVTKGWTSPTLDSPIFAEPLEYRGHVFAVTENNSVYSLNSGDGSLVWHANLGPPVLGGALPCGDLKPITGITGTPTIDPLTGTMYVVAFSAMHHTLFALNASTGSVLFQRQATPPGFDEMVHEERGALLLANGMVYIPYGGLPGDCGVYHGWVVGIPANGTGGMAYYQTPTSREGGIWGPSGPTVDAAGNIYVATGNSASESTFDYGDSVIKLSPSLKVMGYFAPTEWVTLNRDDADLGSLGPAVVGPSTLFQIGKEGIGYLLNASQLGGVGGQTFAARVCDESFGGTAYVAPFIFVPCINGLFELKVANNGTFSTILTVGGFSAGPPIVTGGVVWTVDGTRAMLYGLSAATGYEAYSFSLGNVAHTPCFTPTPAAGDGQIFVAANNRIMSFVLGS